MTFGLMCNLSEGHFSGEGLNKKKMGDLREVSLWHRRIELELRTTREGTENADGDCSGDACHDGYDV